MLKKLLIVCVFGILHFFTNLLTQMSTRQDAVVQDAHNTNVCIINPLAHAYCKFCGFIVGFVISPGEWEALNFNWKYLFIL